MAVSAEDRQYITEHTSFWTRLSVPEQHLLVSGASAVQYRAQQALRSGDRSCIGMIFIKAGELRVYMLSPEGRAVTLFKVEAGDVCVLSAACVLDALAFDVCIDAVSDTDAVIIDPQTYRRLSEQNIYVKEFGYETATKRFSDVMWTMQQILFMKFDRRLAVFLLAQIEKEGRDIRMTHEQIASDTGSAREVVTRMLRYFSSEGVVSLSRGIIRVTDCAKLRRIAGETEI
jgi:CRP/FNR family transcriptional regulator